MRAPLQAMAARLWSTLAIVATMLITVTPAAQAASFALKWSPEAKSDGLKAFEGVEDDKAGSDPGVKHIYVQGNNYRFDMPLKLRDNHPDRQRNEVKGMVDKATGDMIKILKGETWRLRHRIFIPKSLQATTSFTHIMQLMSPEPILFLSLRLKQGVPTIELTPMKSGKTFLLANTPLAPLQDKWIQSQITFTASENGSIEWVLTDVATNAVVRQARGHGDLFGIDRVRPKWGIYRSVSDTAHLQDCYMLISDMKAWKLDPKLDQ